MLTDLLTGNVGGDGLIGSLVCACLSVIKEIFSKDIVRERILYGSVVVLILVGYFDCNEHGCAVHIADADMVGHILV